MSNWNGSSLQTEFSTLLGDTSTAFKAKVLAWINDIMFDISSRHDWPFFFKRGQKVLTASAEQHSLSLAQPTACTGSAAAGGSLTTGSTYNVIVTFYESVSGLESIAGVASSDIAITTPNLTINLTNIPVSSDPLVTSRKIYLIKDDGTAYYYSTISDNTTTTGTITADTTSTIQPPDYQMIRKLDGNPYFETANQLEYRTMDQLRLLFEGDWGDGTPSFWTALGPNRIALYPLPSSALTISFYYYRHPVSIVAETTSQPELPIEFKQVLKAGVIAMGYEYRDRSGQESKRKLYEDLLSNMISTLGSSTRARMRVRDVVGDSDGYEV